LVATDGNPGRRDAARLRLGFKQMPQEFAQAFIGKVSDHLLCDVEGAQDQRFRVGNGRV